MKRRILLFTFLLASSATCICAQDAAKQKELEKSTIKARNAQKAGNLKLAAAEYKKAQSLAVESSAEKVTLSLRYADAVGALALQDPAAVRLQEAEKAYAEVIRGGTPGEKNVARNNLATLLMQTGKQAEALQLYQQLDFSTIPEVQRNLYIFNYGATLHRNGDEAGAYLKYVDAIPFSHAVDGAISIALSSESSNTNRITELADVLLQKNLMQNAAALLRDALKQRATHPDAQQLLAGLVKYFVADRVTPPRFQVEQSSWLMELSQQEGPLAIPIKEIERVYAGPIESAVDASHARAVFPSWTMEGWQRAPFSELLALAARYYHENAEPSMALPRYLSAWVLNERNMEPVLSAAALLRDHAKEVDPEGVVFDSLMNRLFDLKGESYIRGDPKDILRFHVVLGTIYEREKIWGSEHEPRSCLFQWQHALAMEQLIRKADPEYPPSPVLHQHVALAYLNTGQPGQAGHYYLNAAEGFVQQGKPAQAKVALERALQVSSSLNAKDQERLGRIQSSMVQ